MIKQKVIEEFIKELSELQDYKKKFECALKDKQIMSDKLYEYIMKEYENTSYEDRCKEHIEKTCSACRYRFYDCELQNDFPEDIWKPIESDKAWIPGRKSCGEFQWS